MKTNLRETDRVLSLSADGGKSSLGITDPRLFTGENRLHIRMDPQTTLWSFSYEMGILPEPLKEKFTSFKIAVKHATQYFKSRNVTVKEILD